MYVYSVLNAVDGVIKELKEIEKIHTNSVRFTDQTTSFKSDIMEVDKWISIKEITPEDEVIALGYQDEITIGYIRDFMCENESFILEDVTHWKPKPFTINERIDVFNEEYSLEG
ncbi:MAG: DUF551 domain-containing protein [Colwellia sp.]|nr:DUF551 domain-containing protein [Colwellia sp.]